MKTCVLLRRNKLRVYPDPNKIDEWSNNSFFCTELDLNGNPIRIIPNYGTPDVDKILTVDVKIID